MFFLKGNTLAKKFFRGRVLRPVRGVFYDCRDVEYEHSPSRLSL